MMTKKIIKPVVSAQEAVKCIKQGDTIMVGGFNYGGIPYTLVDALYEAGTDHLTMIANDTAYEDVGHGKLVAAGRIKKVIASHVGLNKKQENTLIPEKWNLSFRRRVPSLNV